MTFHELLIHPATGPRLDAMLAADAPARPAESQPPGRASDTTSDPEREETRGTPRYGVRLTSVPQRGLWWLGEWDPTLWTTDPVLAHWFGSATEANLAAIAHVDPALSWVVQPLPLEPGATSPPKEEKTMTALETVIYPCGCSASGTPSVPRYCPTHPRLTADELYRVMQAWEGQPASEEQTRIVVKLGALREGAIRSGDSAFVTPLDQPILPDCSSFGSLA